MGVVGVYNVPPILHTFEDIEKLTVTEYNTIMGKDFKEIPIDTFLNEIKKNVYISDMDFYYDDKNKQFIYKYRDDLNRLISYSFKLDNLTMANYELNKYNNTTLKIKQLVDLYNLKRKELRIINHGNKGKPFNNEEDKLIYINYLQECNNQNKLLIIKNIMKILLVSGGLIGYFIWSIIEKEILITGIIGSTIVIPLLYVIVTYVIADPLLDASVISFESAGAFQFVPAVIFTVTPTYFPFSLVVNVYSAPVAPLMFVPVVAVDDVDVHH